MRQEEVKLEIRQKEKNYQNKNVYFAQRQHHNALKLNTKSKSAMKSTQQMTQNRNKEPKLKLKRNMKIKYDKKH